MVKMMVHNRSKLPELLRTLFGVSNVGAEVGVANGNYASQLLAQPVVFKELYLIDPWTPKLWFKSGATEEEMDSTYLSVLGMANRVEGARVIRSLSEPVSRTFADGYFTFIYIDAAHDYANVKRDLGAWYNKVRAGGVLAGHDIHMPEVERAVKELCDEFKQEYNRVEFEGDPSWFMIKTAA